jgi:hypothetical protein
MSPHTQTIARARELIRKLPPGCLDCELDAIIANAIEEGAKQPVRENCTRDGIGNETTYRPQHLDGDGEFDAWCDIGFPTASWQNAASRLAMFRSIHPDARTRVLKVRSTITVCELPPPTESIKDALTREGFEQSGNETGEPQT